MLAHKDVPFKLEGEHRAEKPAHEEADEQEKVAACRVLDPGLGEVVADTPVEKHNEQAVEDTLTDLRENGLRLSRDESLGAPKHRLELQREGRALIGSPIDVKIAVSVSFHVILDDSLQLLAVLLGVPRDYFLVTRLLGVINGQLAHEIVTRVLLSTILAEAKVLSDLQGQALISHISIRKQDQPITV